ncbi:MAG: zinc-ribbon domain-containing protein [Ardenticatenales bacterium]|nr:zinc-ribbon domain-containing protein [Ardenticatenales bacterium]
MFCPQCGAKNADTENFCNQCGTALKQAVSPSPIPGSTLNMPATTPAQPANVQYTMPAATSSGRVRLDKLGQRIDGWADLIDNQAGEASRVRQLLIQRLRQRNMPQVTISHKDVTPGGLLGETRPYQISLHKVGTTLAVYIGEFGTDLYIAWDVFVKLLWRWWVFLLLLILDFLAVGIASEGMLFDYFEDYLSFLVAGYVGLFILGGIAGLIFKRSFMAFYQHQYNHFRADDIAAMTLAVHKSILEVLDEVGINTALVRKKDEFRGGQRERII